MNTQRMHQLTKRLVEIDSVTGNEGNLTDLLETELRGRGMSVQVMPVEGNRCNLLATFDPGSSRILFNTHLDTVPEQYGPHEDDDYIYGRGACDACGILAAQLEALELLHKDGISGLGMLLDVGEERDHSGAIHAATVVPEPEIFIVGEPTENKLMAGQKGVAKADIIARGRPGHSGYPEHFLSATDILLAVLSALGSQRWPVDPILGPTTVNIGLLQGGDSHNKIAGYARAGLAFRIVEPYEDLRTRVETIVRTCAEIHGIAFGPESAIAIDWLVGNDPIFHLETIPGFETAVAAFNTDIPYFGWHTARTYLLGPGSILDAHTDNEKISKAEQARGVDLYCQLVREAIRV
jgi:acetylornithine deacetylase